MTNILTWNLDAFNTGKVWGGVVDTSTRSAADRIELEYYMLTVAEINEVTDLTNILIWNLDAFNTGKVWGK